MYTDSSFLPCTKAGKIYARTIILDDLPAAIVFYIFKFVPDFREKRQELVIGKESDRPSCRETASSQQPNPLENLNPASDIYKLLVVRPCVYKKMVKECDAFAVFWDRLQHLYIERLYEEKSRIQKDRKKGTFVAYQEYKHCLRNMDDTCLSFQEFLDSPDYKAVMDKAQQQIEEVYRKLEKARIRRNGKYVRGRLSGLDIKMLCSAP